MSQRSALQPSEAIPRVGLTNDRFRVPHCSIRMRSGGRLRAEIDALNSARKGGECEFGAGANLTGAYFRKRTDNSPSLRFRAALR